jgi:hypothetical protein
MLTYRITVQTKKMKKHLRIMVLAVILITGMLSNRAFAGVHVAPDSASPATATRMEQIKARLEEIKEMDKTALTHEERRALRREVKAMHHEVTQVRARGGIYLSVGAVLLIILVLIIVL